MADWNSLSTELKLMTLAHLETSKDSDSSHLHHLSSYATVSREWQIYFEKPLFKKLAISQRDLSNFTEILNSRRISHVETVALYIELPRYTCARCESSETIEEAAQNTLLVTAALLRLFTILSSWTSKPVCSLDLFLGVYSPSDREHHFRDYRRTIDGICSTGIEYNDPAYGWYLNERTAPCIEARRRLLGRPLEFDFTRDEAMHTIPLTSLPKLDLIKGLFIPRNFFRAVPNADRIVSALPKLESLVYEIWCPPDNKYHKQRFTRMLHALPATLKSLIAYEQSNYAQHPTFEKHFPLFKFTWPSSLWSRTLEPNLTVLNLSFIVDAQEFFCPFPGQATAGDFFRPKNERVQWPNLEVLTMTSWMLSKRYGARTMDALLNVAAKAALRMPKLRLMQLWWAKPNDGCVFVCKRTSHEGLSIELCSNRERWPPSFFHVRAWMAVAEKYTEARFHATAREIEHEIVSHASVFPYLDCRYLGLPNSVEDIRWEAKHREYQKRLYRPSLRQPPSMAHVAPSTSR